MLPLAYHIIWTTYGTWLPGDERGWFQRGTVGVQPPDPERERQARRIMSEPPVELTPVQRDIIEQTIRDHCRIRNWQLHAVNVWSNHVHLVVTADRDANEVMKQLKAWCSRKLSDADGLEKPVARTAGRRRWFTEGGWRKVIENEAYLEHAVLYVLEGQ